MGDPDAAYEPSPEAQGRLLGWIYARSVKATPVKRPDPNRIDLIAMLRSGS